MKIAIITAMPEESKAVLKKVTSCKKSSCGSRKRYQGQFNGHEISLVEAGMGMLNAGWAATALASEKPDLLISTGFGGAVIPGLNVGDLVMAGQILQYSASGFEEIPVGFYGLNSYAAQLGIPLGSFISNDVILQKTQLAAQLPEAVKIPVVEMETAAIARVAAANGIPFLAIRAISDPWDEELDFNIDEFCDENKQIRIPKVLATIARKPRIIPQLIRLAGNSNTAAKKLSTSVTSLLKAI